MKSGFEQKEYYIVCTFAFESHVNKFKVQQKESCGSSRRKWNPEVAVNFILQERISSKSTLLILRLQTEEAILLNQAKFYKYFCE